jgi:amidase
MAGADARDPFWMPVAFDSWPEAREPIRVGVTTESYGHPMHPDIVESIDRAACYLSDAGYRVETVTPPSVDDAASAWFTYLGAELEAFLMPSAKAHGSEMIQQIFEWYFEMGQVTKPAEYQVGIKNRTAMTRKWNQFLEETPLLLSPYFLQPTPDWDCDAKSLEGTRALFDSAIYSTGINWVSLPAGVTPIGMIAGRPAGVQIIGRRFREDLILDAMEAVESRVGILTEQLWARED